MVAQLPEQFIQGVYYIKSKQDYLNPSIKKVIFIHNTPAFIIYKWWQKFDTYKRKKNIATLAMKKLLIHTAFYQDQWFQWKLIKDKTEHECVCYNSQSSKLTRRRVEK